MISISQPASCGYLFLPGNKRVGGLGQQSHQLDMHQAGLLLDQKNGNHERIGSGFGFKFGLLILELRVANANCVAG